VLNESWIKTSLAYNNERTLKLCRQPTPATNLDVELDRALRKIGNEHVAQLRAAIEFDRGDNIVTLGMLQDFATNPVDGWDMATISVRDLLLTQCDLRADQVGGDFAAEAFRLGHAVAATHADLALKLGTNEQDSRDLADAMNARLSAAVSRMPALSEHAPSIKTAYAEVSKLSVPVTAQWIHGELHLHNVLRTPSGWLLTNFGGETTRPPLETMRPASVLRDVAGSCVRSTKSHTKGYPI
jgi:maltokinase